MFVLINQPPEPGQIDAPRTAKGWDVVWNRPSSKSWVSYLVALGGTGAAWGHTPSCQHQVANAKLPTPSCQRQVANLNPGEKCALGMKKYGKFCCHSGNFWFTSTGIIEGSSGVLVPPLIPIWPTSKLGEVVQGLVQLSFETPGCRYHHFPGQLFPVLDHQPSWWKFLPRFEPEFPLLHLWHLSLVPLFCISAKSLALSFSVTYHAVRQREALLLPPKIANEGIRTEPMYSW